MRISIIFIILSFALNIYCKDLFVCAIEYPPYTSSNMEGYGISFEILKEALIHTNYKIVPSFFPTGRAFSELEAGYYHINLYNTPSVSELKFYKRIDTHSVLYTFFYNKDFNNVDWDELSDLKGLRLGSIRVKNKETIRDELLEAGIIPVQTDSLVQIFSMLKQGHIDIALAVDLTAIEVLRNLYPNDTSIVKTKKEYMRIIGGPWFNTSIQEGLEAMEEFEVGKAKMIENGNLIKIMEKYYGVGMVPPGSIIE